MGGRKAETVWKDIRAHCSLDLILPLQVLPHLLGFCGLCSTLWINNANMSHRIKRSCYIPTKPEDLFSCPVVKLRTVCTKAAREGSKAQTNLKMRVTQRPFYTPHLRTVVSMRSYTLHNIIGYHPAHIGFQE